MVANNFSKRNHPVFGEIETVTDPNGTILYDATTVAKSLGYSHPHLIVSQQMKDQPIIVTGSTTVNNGAVFTHRKRYCSEKAAFLLALKGSTGQCQALREWVFEALFPLLKDFSHDWLHPYDKGADSLINLLFAVLQTLDSKPSEFAEAYTERLNRLTKE